MVSERKVILDLKPERKIQHQTKKKKHEERKERIKS